MNTRFFLHGFSQPSPYFSIDTLQVARSNFAMSSNKMDYLNEVLNISRKIENEGLALWIKAMNGDVKALNDMETYNVGDIIALEELYERIRPWIKAHPNVTEKKDCCAACGSDSLEYIRDFGKAYSYAIYRCNSCGSLSKSSKSVKLDKSNLRSYTAK
jgi:hypothetical protein